ncbi:hypothetical protein C8R46DRAFT_1044850 [Mycena filopes]|nr:hypothetical protein C8R46DRAFT_1044850 [Mycena filopes]
MSSNRFLPAFDVELDDLCGSSCSLWIVQNLSCSATTLIRGGSRSKSIWCADWTTFARSLPERTTFQASLQLSPRAPQVLGDDDRLQGRFYVYVSLSRGGRRCEDALRPSGLPPRLASLARSPRSKCSAPLHDHTSFDRSVSPLQLRPSVCDAQTVPTTSRLPLPILVKWRRADQGFAARTSDESVRAGQCDEDDLRSHRSELGPARSLCAVLPLSETGHARSRRRTLSSAAPFPYQSRLNHGQSIPHRPPVDLVDAGRRTFDTAAVAMGADASSLPPLHSSGNARGQVWGRLIASTASPPTGAMARFWASDMGPILTTSTLGLTPSRLGELTATGTTRGGLRQSR